jgi:hypothetical protein
MVLISYNEPERIATYLLSSGIGTISTQEMKQQARSTVLDIVIHIKEFN